MKNKSPKDPFKTHCWAYTIVADPYQVFAECFIFADIGSVKMTIRQVLCSVDRKKVHKKDEPASVLNLFNAVNSVILAAWELYRQKKTSALKIEPGQFTDKRLYARPGTNCAEWDYLPKNLSAGEYQNPYKVFSRFFKHGDAVQWQHHIKEVLNYALSSCTNDCELDLLKLYLQLTRLMEAAHLIDVREVLHIGGHLKPALVKEG